MASKQIAPGIQAEIISKDGKPKTVKLELAVSSNPVASASGKSLVLATTRGAVDLGEGLKLNINLYKSNK